MTYNDRSKGDLHVILRLLDSNRRSEKNDRVSLTMKHARVRASVIVQPFEDRLGRLGEESQSQKRREEAMPVM